MFTDKDNALATLLFQFSAALQKLYESVKRELASFNGILSTKK